VPISIRCQNCKKLLRVPDALVGKQVKCPGCGQAVVAQPPEEEPTSVVEIDEEAESERQRSTSPATLEPSGGTLEDDEEAPDDSVKRSRRGKEARRQRAGSAAKAPGIAMLIVGGLGLAMALLILAVQFTGTGPLRLRNPQANRDAPVVPQGPMGQAQREAITQIYGTWVMVSSVASVLWGVIVLLGGYFLYQLNSWSTVMFASIVAMLPCHPCCLLGMPVGIWALVVINRPEVKSAFET